MNENPRRDPRLVAIPDTHGHAKGEHKPFVEERPLPLTARMLFLWFYHACRRGYPRFLMVADHMNYLTFEDPAAVNLVRRALKLAQAGDLYGAAETANVDVAHAAVVSEGLRRGMRYSIGAEVDNDPRSRPDASNIVDAMRPDAIIRSVHFVQITHPVHGEGWHWPFDNPEFHDLFEIVGTEQTWELYVTALVDAIERLPGHIVGHFFVPAVFGHWPDDASLSGYEDRVLDAAAARQMAVEFNTRFLYRDHTEDEKQRYLAANKRFLRKAKARGVGIAIGSDAHSPKDQGGAFETVLEVLDELDINEIVFPLGGTLRRVALRVERKPEPEPAPPAEPVKAATAAGAGEAEKPLRKARPSAKPSRAPATSPDRPPERPEVSASADATGPAAPGRATAPPPKPEPSGKPPDGSAQPGAASPKPAATKSSAAKAGAGSKAPVPAPAPIPKTQPGLKAAAGAKAATLPKAASAAKAVPAPKAGAGRPAPARKGASGSAVAGTKATPSRAKAPAVRAGAAKPSPAKPAAKSAAAASPRSKTAAKPTVRGAKAAAPRGGSAKGAAKKPAAKAPARKPLPSKTAKKAGSGKAQPAKKAAPKKPAPARSKAKKPAPKKALARRPAPARKAPAAKKPTAKKNAAKRR